MTFEPMAMWRWTWWSRTTRRLAPFALLFLVLYIIYLHVREVRQGADVQSKPLATRTPPSPDPGLVTWVVVDARGAPPAEACHGALNLYNSWTVLVYGVDKPDANSVSRCRYLPNLDSPLWSKLGIADNTLSEELKAYLYAIKEGAEAIYVQSGRPTASGSRTEAKIVEHTYEGLMYGAQSGSSAHFRALEHFGCRTEDETSVQNPGPSPVYNICKHKVPAIHAPAYITIPHFTVTQDGSDRTREIAPCDRRAPPVTLQVGTFADIELQEALYTSDAFWALGLQSINTKGHNIALGYTIQKLLSLVGQRIQVHYNEGLALTKSESPALKTTAYLNKITQNLNQWNCQASEFMLCVNDLFSHLGALRLLETDLKKRLTVWWEALLQIDYNYPVLGEGELDLKCYSGQVIFHPIDLNLKIPWRQYRSKPFQPLANAEQTLSTFQQTCSSYKIKADSFHTVNLTHPWSQAESILLIVIFNTPHYEAIPYVELLYRPFYPNLVYCGPGLPDLKKFPQLANYKLTFLSYNPTPAGHFPGAFNYECVAMVMQMQYAVKGFLVISDDMFVSFSHLSGYSDQAVWFLPKAEVKIGELTHLMECRLGMCDFHPHWRWWEDYQAQTLSALAELKQRHHHHYTFYRCYRQLIEITGGDGRAHGAYSDIFYIPQRLATQFSTMAEFFLEKQVFLEIAVPSILWCLERPEKITEMKGFQSWELSRDQPWVHFNKRNYLGKVYFHPVKWGHLVAGVRKMSDLLCTSLLPYLHDPYGRMLANT